MPRRLHGHEALEQFLIAIDAEAPSERLDDLHHALAWARAHHVRGASVDGTRTPQKRMATINLRPPGVKSFLTIYHDSNVPSIMLPTAFEARAPVAWRRLNASGFVRGRSLYDFSPQTFGILDEAILEASATERAVATPKGLAPYRSPSLAGRHEPREPFVVDPNELDRATRRHKEIQLTLQAVVIAAGHELKGGNSFADIDIGWQTGAGLVIAEVKTTTDKNQSRQLRLGLGQLLDYTNALSAEFAPVHGVLVTEHKPPERWIDLCQSHGIAVAWPPSFDGAFADV